MNRMHWRRWFHSLAKRKIEDFRACVWKFYDEIMIHDGSRLTDQLVHALTVDGPVALFVDVDAVGRAGGIPVDEYPKGNRRAGLRRSYDEFDIAGVEAIDQAAVVLIYHRRFPADGPVTGKGPLIDGETGGRGVFVWV